MTETMKAAVIREKGEISIEEREVPEPGQNEVRIEVRASGVCHSDVSTVENQMPVVDLPRVPGHEVAGIVDKKGENVDRWHEGDRVGVGWHGGHCFNCEKCRRGRFLKCENQEITGVTRDGGHAEYMIARKEALAEIPDGLDFEEAAPVMCAGVTTFNALRNTDARPGNLVAVQGVGGLGHLGIQYADIAGFETVAVSHSPEKKEYAKKLGADHFIDSSSQDVSQELKNLGGADVILCTAPVKEAIESTFGGIDIDGNITIVGIPEEPVEVPVVPLLDAQGKVSGHSAGHAMDSQDTLEFTEREDIDSEIETFPLEEYQVAYKKMMENNVRFRAVLVMNSD